MGNLTTAYSCVATGVQHGDVGHAFFVFVFVFGSLYMNM